MKKYIKICMRNKEHSITLPFEVAEQILNSPDQITMLKKDGVWTGEIINKSEIVATHRDRDEEKHENYNEKQIAELESKPIDISRFKPDFLK
jgi:hypothetical protein